jgi:hypothetical protein
MDSALGEILTYIIRDQFTRLMKSDPFFYKRDEVLNSETWTTDIIDWPSEGVLASVINRNTEHFISPTRNVFFTHGTSSGWGDPHFKDWSGDTFDFHGECDLVLGSAPSFANGRGLTVHVRTTHKWDWSYIESAVVQIGQDTFEIGSFGEYFLNGVEGLEMPAKIAGFDIDLAVSNKKKTEFHIKIGQDSKLVLSSYKFLVRVDWDISGVDAAEFRDSFGLMGAWGNGTHFGRDGTTIIEDANEFGQEWQVRDTDPKLFDRERIPQYPTQCRMPDVEAAAAKRRRLGENAVTVEQASAACSHVVDKKIHEMCMNDVIATQDLQVGQGSY